MEANVTTEKFDTLGLFGSQKVPSADHGEMIGVLLPSVRRPETKAGRSCCVTVQIAIVSAFVLFTSLTTLLIVLSPCVNVTSFTTLPPSSLNFDVNESQTLCV